MENIILTLRLDGRCILKAKSDSDDASLSFQDLQNPSFCYTGGRKVISILSDDVLKRSLEPDFSAKLDLSLILTEEFQIARDEDGRLVVTDSWDWWVPLEDCTIEDLIDQAGFRSHAGIVNVVNPFIEFNEAA